MGFKIKEGNLGELVHQSEYKYSFDPSQKVLGESIIDGNGHVNNIGYTVLVEDIRRNRFLPHYGFSDQILNEMGWQQIRRSGAATFRKGLASKEETRVDLSFYVEPKIWFHMVFDFVDSEGNQAARIVTNDFWNQRQSGIWVPYKGKCPAFFLNKIRNI